jgi:hypothetical protein
MTTIAAPAASSRIIAPRRGRVETALVAGVAVVVLGVGALIHLANPSGDTSRQELAEWQVSAFTGFGRVDQAIHSALTVAAQEIFFVQQTYAEWLTVEDLETTFVPPFAKDAFWRNNGEMTWELFQPVGEAESAQGVTYYFGHGGKAEGQGSFMIVQRHSHAGFNAVTQGEIWYHPDPNVQRPTELRQDSLIRNGWKQAVAYSGADEAARIR